MFREFPWRLAHPIFYSMQIIVFMSNYNKQCQCCIRCQSIHIFLKHAGLHSYCLWQSKAGPSLSALCPKQSPWLQWQEVEPRFHVIRSSALIVVRFSVPLVWGGLFAPQLLLRYHETVPPQVLCFRMLYSIFLLFIPLLPLAAKSLPHLIAIWLGSICILSLGTFQHAALLPFLVWGFTTFITFYELYAEEVSWSLSLSPSPLILRFHLGLPTRLKYLLHVVIRFFWIQCLQQGYLGH